MLIARNHNSAFTLLAFHLSFLALTNVCFSQDDRTIFIENADITLFESTSGKQWSRLLGNVRFNHGETYMTCDSAHYYPPENRLDAFSNVHIWKGDTLNLYGDFVKYRGNDKFAEIRRNVTMVDKENSLTTDYIDYDMKKDFAYFLGGGRIINGDSELTSRKGYYYPADKIFFFRDSVVVNNPKYNLNSDTLKYNTLSKTAYFYGPTEIRTDSNYIYCENGWYDNETGTSQFNKNAYIETKKQILKGDSIYYERATGIGRAYKNVEIIDTASNIVVSGNKAVYYQKTDFGVVSDSAMLVIIDRKDSLYIHADTIRSEQDTLPDHRIMRAFKHVKMFRKDLQGKCDSLVYSDIDSVIQFHGDPVLWTEENQLTAAYIMLQTKNRALHKLVMQNSAFIISQEDSVRFNQIKGRNMEGFFRNNELWFIDVTGNGQTIYYARDKGKIMGVNTAESSDIRIYLKNRKVERINFLTKPAAVYYPLSKFPEKESRLENFRWLQEYRPVKREDIFLWDQSGQSTVLWE